MKPPQTMTVNPIDCTIYKLKQIIMALTRESTHTRPDRDNLEFISRQLIDTGRELNEAIHLRGWF